VINHQWTNKLHKQPYQICTKTVMDTSDPLITFDDLGVCNHVINYNYWNHNKRIKGNDAKNKLDELSSLLRKDGKGKDYDCIMGLSGGVDSSYMCYFVTKVLGLRPLVVHVDTGWNSELSVSNIKNIVQILNLDLHTVVIDWEEMRDLQLAYFKSGIANIDVPQDHCFISSLYKEAKKFNIKYIMNGGNMATESILPHAWGYDAIDSTNILAIHKKYGSLKLKTFPLLSHFESAIFYPFIKRIRVIRPLEYVDYNKKDVKKFLIEKFNWRDYGGKHYESKFTKFFQAHYLPAKFGFDKRKAHLSSLIVSGQMTREEAITELKLPLYDPLELEEDTLYFTKKLGISMNEYFKIMESSPSYFNDFSNQQSAREFLNSIIRTLTKFIKFKL
jgi:N-acetyl sugar amidotransferase